MSKLDTSRLNECFHKLKKQDHCALVTFLTCGYPDLKTFQNILEKLPDHGADIIEVGMPFTDPMADGPAIQKANLKALSQGLTLQDIFKSVSDFRQKNDHTPIILMGYYNPIYTYGVQAFLSEAKRVGVDGFIVVDVPPEEDDLLWTFCDQMDLSLIRLVTPTTDEKRLPKVLENTSGFLYYVSVTGITGTQTPDPSQLRPAIENLKKNTHLPVAVGFGLRSPEHMMAVGSFADAAVVGSALINVIDGTLHTNGMACHQTVQGVLDYVSGLSQALKKSRHVK